MDKKRLLLGFGIVVLLVFLLIFSFSNSFVRAEENENKGFTTDGLEFKGVEPNFTENSIDFEVYNQKLSLTPAQVFSPDELKGALTGEQYELVSWNGWENGEIVSNEASLTIGYQYENAQDLDENPFPNEDVSSLLGNDWKADSKYPQNYFSPYSTENASIDNKSMNRVFNFNFKDENSDYNVSWDIEVSSHYNHLIINYELWFSNSTTTEKVHTFQDVYSGEKPDLLPVEGQINKYEPVGTNSYKDRFLMRLDNKYGDSYTANVTIAYPDNKDLWKVDFGDYNEIENRYNEVVTKANNLNKTNTLLDTTDGYTIKSYSVEIPKNQTKPLSYFIDSEKGEYNDLRMWVEGSFAGGSGTSDDPYQISNCSNLQEIKDSSGLASYELINNIDCSNTTNWNYTCNDNETCYGFEPINNDFEGVLDGQDYHINDLYIEISNSSFVGYEVGMFTDIDNGGLIQNLAMYNFDITGDSDPSMSYTGGLVGNMYSSNSEIINCFINGSVTDGNGVGGFTGYGDGKIINSYSRIDVGEHRSYYVGGLMGYGGGIVNQSYFSGNLNGNDAGGICSSYSAACSADCYNTFWDEDASNDNDTSQCSGATPKSYTEMITVDTYTDLDTEGLDVPWDFLNNPNDDTNNEDIWNIDSDINDNYPFILSFYEDRYPPTINIIKPQNKNYGDNESILLNYTIKDSSNISSCWYNVYNETDNLIIDNTTLTNCENSTFDLPGGDSDYTLTLYSNDTEGNLGNETRDFGIRTNSPSIELYYPGDGKEWLDYDENIKFNFTSTDSDGIDTCKLYGNWTGNWTVNETFSNVTSGETINTTKNISDSNNNVWNVECNDTVGNSGFALENYTFSVDTIPPGLDIKSPENGTTYKSSEDYTSISLDYLVSDSNLDYCEYNLTSTDGGNNISTRNLDNCENETFSAKVTDTEGEKYTYELTHCSYDKAGNKNCSFNSDYSVKFFTEYEEPEEGGGGGGAPVEQINWSMTTERGDNIYSWNVLPNQKRSGILEFINNDDENLSVTMDCEGDLCNYIEFEQDRFDLPVQKDVEVQKDFTLSLTETVDDGEYFVNLIAVDQNSKTQVVTVEINVDKTNILSGIIQKLGESIQFLGIPIFIIFIGSLFIISFVASEAIPKKVQGGAFISFLIGFVSSLTIVYFI